MEKSLPALDQRRIILKNKQHTYHPYCNPNESGYQHAKKLAARAELIASGEIVLRPLMTDEQLEALNSKRRNAISSR